MKHKIQRIHFVAEHARSRVPGDAPRSAYADEDRHEA